MVDPIITNLKSAFKVLTPQQVTLWKTVEAGNRANKQIEWMNRLMGGIPPIKRSDVLKKIGQWHESVSVGIAAKVNNGAIAATGIDWQAHADKKIQEVLTPRTLEEVNEIMASELAAQLPMEVVNALAKSLTVKPGASQKIRRALAAIVMAKMANSAGVVLDEYIAESKRTNGKPNMAKLRGNTLQVDASGKVITEQAPAGSGSTFSRGFNKLIRHPLKWLRRVFVTEVGKGLRKLMATVLELIDSNQFIAQFLIKPTGLNVLVKALEQIGVALEDGSINSFDEKAVGNEAVQTLASAGNLLKLAAPILVATGVGTLWGAAAAALGALSSNLAVLLDNAMHSKSRDKARQQAVNAQADAKSKAATDFANNQNRLYGLMQAAQNAGVLRQGWKIRPDGKQYWIASLSGNQQSIDVGLFQQDQIGWYPMIQVPMQFSPDPALRQQAAVTQRAA